MDNNSADWWNRWNQSLVSWWPILKRILTVLKTMLLLGFGIYMLWISCVLIAVVGPSVLNWVSPQLVPLDIHSHGGFFTADVLLTNTGKETLGKIDLSISAYFENGISSGEAHWGEWKPGEIKTINVTQRSGRIQRIHLTGSAINAQDRAQRRIYYDVAMEPAK